MQQEVLFHKYQIRGLLGRGGTAKVYLAEHIILKSFRAIKFIPKNHPLYDLQRKEAFILKNLKHSCIPTIYDIEENEEGSYIVEQYLEGLTLKEYVTSMGHIREDIIVKYAIQLCDLIHYLHSIEKPIIYIDLKPDNIIVSGEELKLIDFGSAFYRDDVTDGQLYAATKGYAAPELYRRGKVDERCEVYGIGMLLYYMVTGRQVDRNLDSYVHIDQAAGCSKQLGNMINRCLKFHPYQRYASVDRLHRQLSALSKKNQFQTVLDKTVTIAVAGSQPRIGVTHLCFLLCRYMMQKRFQCLYVESNDSRCIRSIKSRYEDIAITNGVCILEGIHMVPKNNEKISSPGSNTEAGSDLTKYFDYQVILLDYGCLTGDKLNAYLKADIKLLVLGAKDWELEASEKALELVSKDEEITFLFNFMDGFRFQQAAKSMKGRHCYRIPYEPEPFRKHSAINDFELLEELLQLLGKPKSK